MAGNKRKLKNPRGRARKKPVNLPSEDMTSNLNQPSVKMTSNLNQSRLDMTSNLNQRAFECPMCLEVLKAPIFQCSNGHLICDDCIEIYVKCPSCMVSLKERVRNLALEQLAMGALHDCPNLENGCLVKCVLSELDNHVQNLCHYEARIYCSNLGINCDVRVNLANFGKHLETHDITGWTSHEAVIQQNLPEMQNLTGITELKWNQCYLLFDGNIFVLSTKADFTEKCTSWMVTVMAPPTIASRYKYRIELLPLCPDKKQQQQNLVFTCHEGPVLSASNKNKCSSLNLFTTPFCHLMLVGSYEQSNNKTVYWLRVTISYPKN